MDKEFKAKVVEALRSGEYQQGTGVLRDSQNRFCCLGVMCDIAGLPWKLVAGLRYHCTGVEYAILPDDFRRSIGMTYNQQDALYHMNDNGESFEEIADFMESPEFEELGDA